jgi:hypothetical protein
MLRSSCDWMKEKSPKDTRRECKKHTVLVRVVGNTTAVVNAVLRDAHTGCDDRQQCGRNSHERHTTTIETDAHHARNYIKKDGTASDSKEGRTATKLVGAYRGPLHYSRDQRSAQSRWQQIKRESSLRRPSRWHHRSRQNGDCNLRGVYRLRSKSCGTFVVCCSGSRWCHNKEVRVPIVPRSELKGTGRCRESLQLDVSPIPWLWKGPQIP